jgi:ribosomal protein S18 acetylase RimI-like enzyme
MPMSDVIIRPPRDDELDAVGELTAHAYLVDGPISDRYAAILADARSRHRDAELLVAVNAEGELLGTITLALPGGVFADVAQDGELEFRMLAVAPSAQRRGIGEALVRAVIDRARELAVPTVILSSQDRMTTAHRLYERLGFRRLPDRDWEIPHAGIRLVVYALDV